MSKQKKGSLKKGRERESYAWAGWRKNVSLLIKRKEKRFALEIFQEETFISIASVL